MQNRKNLKIHLPQLFLPPSKEYQQKNTTAAGIASGSILRLTLAGFRYCSIRYLTSRALSIKNTNWLRCALVCSLGLTAVANWLFNLRKAL